MKSLSFSNEQKCERVRLLQPGDRAATMRFWLYFLLPGEQVHINDKLAGEAVRALCPAAYPAPVRGKGRAPGWVLYDAEIEAVNPKRLRDLTTEDAALDLFPELSGPEFQAIFPTMYRGIKPDHWGFQIVFRRLADAPPALGDPVSSLDPYLTIGGA